MRVLVTGGAGFIGSHLVDPMLDRGADVAVADHLPRSPRPWVADALQRGAQLHVADVRELPALRRAFEAARPEVVLHLAAQVDVRRSIADPSFDAQVNVAGTVSVLEAAAEWYLGQYQRLHGISTLALRMANVYGPRQDPHGEAGVVSIFCGHAATGARATVFRDGRQTRDSVFIEDVVKAWLAAADSDVTGAINVSTGTETSLLDLVAALDLPYDRAPTRAGEIERSCLDPGAALERLGWHAATPLADGLRRTVEAIPA